MSWTEPDDVHSDWHGEKYSHSSMPGVQEVISAPAVVARLESWDHSDTLAAGSALLETMLGHSLWCCACHLKFHEFAELKMGLTLEDCSLQA